MWLHAPQSENQPSPCILEKMSIRVFLLTDLYLMTILYFWTDIYFMTVLYFWAAFYLMTVLYFWTYLYLMTVLYNLTDLNFVTKQGRQTKVSHQLVW